MRHKKAGKNKFSSHYDHYLARTFWAISFAYRNHHRLLVLSIKCNKQITTKYVLRKEKEETFSSVGEFKLI